MTLVSGCPARVCNCEYLIFTANCYRRPSEIRNWF